MKKNYFIAMSLIASILIITSCEDDTNNLTKLPDDIFSGDSIYEIYDDSLVLEAAELPEGIKGYWEVIENTDLYSLSDIHNPKSVFTGELLGDYKLRWTVTNCSESKSVDIIIKIVGFTDTRDGIKYKAVRLGEQIWMAENLAYLPEVHNNTDFASMGSIGEPAYGVYDYDGNNVTIAKNDSNYYTYGVLYNWYVIEKTTVCPSGWHVPSDEEWQQLEIYLGMSEVEADLPDWRGTNEGSKLAGNSDLWNNGFLENDSEFGTSGFNALPGGYRNDPGTFGNLGNNAYFWSATEYNTLYAWYRALFYDKSGIHRFNSYDKMRGRSIRCIKD